VFPLIPSAALEVPFEAEAAEGTAGVPVLQESTVHGLPSSQPLAGCVHTPPEQTSVVHELPSLAHDAVLFTFAGQPLPGLHVPSSVHTSPSSHEMVGCVHVPPLHTSVVHELPSLAHDAVLFTFAGQPVAGTHVPSFVHTFPSSQFSGVPDDGHTPPEHTSEPSHRSASAHDAVLLLNAHFCGVPLQASVVQTLPS
jgi:hypothetical protein